MCYPQHWLHPYESLWIKGYLIVTMFYLMLSQEYVLLGQIMINTHDHHPRKLSLRSSSNTTGSRLLLSCTTHKMISADRSVITVPCSPSLPCHPASGLMLWQCKLHQSLHWGGHMLGHSSDTQWNTLSACSQRNTNSILTTRVLSLSHTQMHTHRAALHHMLTSLTHEVLWPWREINYTLILLCSGTLLQKTDVYLGWSLNNSSSKTFHILLLP